MKKSFIIFFGEVIVLCCAAFVSCSQASVPSVDEPILAEACNVTVSVKAPASIAFARSGLAASDREKAYENAYVLVYDSSGVLVDSKAWSGSALDFVLPGGSYTFVGALNCGSYVLQKNTLSALNASVASLSDDLDYFTMLGQSKASVSGEAVNNVVIVVKRMAAKVILRNVTRSMASPVVAAQSFVIESFYMQNVAGDGIYDEVFNQGSGSVVSTWYNRMKYEPGACDSYLYKDMRSFALGQGETVDFRTEDDSVVFYVYPNSIAVDAHGKDVWSPRKTRFVISAELNGAPTYYPLTFDQSMFSGLSDDGIEANHVYAIVGLTITGPGVDDPEDPWVKSVAVDAVIEVADWDEGGEVTYEF